MLDLTKALARQIASSEAQADELTQTAIALSGQHEARMIQRIAIQKRVKAIELRGQLAALREEYAARFHSKT